MKRPLVVRGMTDDFGPPRLPQAHPASETKRASPPHSPLNDTPPGPEQGFSLTLGPSRVPCCGVEGDGSICNVEGGVEGSKRDKQLGVVSIRLSITIKGIEVIDLS